jgi:ankyrin repeat protein
MSVVGSWKPLSWAAVDGHEVTVKLLVDNGADIEANHNGGRTPLWWISTK